MGKVFSIVGIIVAVIGLVIAILGLPDPGVGRQYIIGMIIVGAGLLLAVAGMVIDEIKMRREWKERQEYRLRP